MLKKSSLQTLQRMKPLIGTYVTVAISAYESENDLLKVSNAVFNRIRQLENLLSFYKDGSEVNMINKLAYLHSVPISRDTEYLLTKALELSELSDGVFDISITAHLVKKGYLPNDGSFIFDDKAIWKDIEIKDHTVRFKRRMQIDLGGIAKGYIVDQALAVVPKDYDVTINAGGDIRMSHWHDKVVEIKDPRKDFTQTVKLNMKNSSVATSSYYYHDGYSKIVLPASGNFVEEKDSVSVFADNCMIADALTKVVFLAKNYEEIIQKFQAETFIITKH